MTTVFVSSPYKHPNAAIREDRARAAGDACAWLVRQGYLPMSPIVQWHDAAARNGLPDDAESWRKWNQRWLEKADAVAFLRIDGWQDSDGMAMELEWAKDKPQAVLEPHNGGFRWVGAGEQERLLSGALRRSDDPENVDPYGPQNHPLGR